MSDIVRKLASIRTINALKPIPGADMIECAVIDGWEVVVKKGEFTAGSPCIYFEIDSFLPVRPEYEFLRKSSFKSTAHLGDGFRLRTIKLRGQISQGLALPITQQLPTGSDVTEFLGVKKWEAPQTGNVLAGSSASTAGSFPRFIRKTDQERVQNCFEQIKRLHPETEFEVSLKLDGSSMTVWHKDGKSGVCSRNLNLRDRVRYGWLKHVRTFGEFLHLKRPTLDVLEEKIDALKCLIFGGQPMLTKERTIFWEIAHKTRLIDFLEAVGGNYALQGELMGPGIQGNREALTEHWFYLFDVWDIDRQRYLSPHERYDFLHNWQSRSNIMIDSAPILRHIKVKDLNSVADCLAIADRKSMTHAIAEGVVFKSHDGQTSFKAINNAYLLKEAA